MSSDQREWTGPVTTRLRCCICGDDTEGADDYVVIGVITEQSSGEIHYLAHTPRIWRGRWPAASPSRSR
jgi:hypothetical protein